MKIVDTIKTHIPLQDIQTILAVARTKLPKKTVKIYPGLAEAQKIIKRIDFLFAEKPIVNLGKQDIFKREISKENGTKTIYTYTVDFASKDQVKRLRDFLIELVDLAADDATSEKKESIPGYLDYIAMASA